MQKTQLFLEKICGLYKYYAVDFYRLMHGVTAILHKTDLVKSSHVVNCDFLFVIQNFLKWH